MIARLKSYPTLAIILSMVSMAVLTFTLVQQDGVAIDWDSMGFISMANHVLAGDGFDYYHGEPYSYKFPPGYPTALAITSYLTTPNIYHAAAMLNVVLYGILVLASLLLLREMTANKWTLAIGILLITTSYPVLNISRVALSDLPFISLSMVVVLWLYHVHRRQRIDWTTIMGITLLVVAATMTRWLGISVALMTSIVFTIVVWERSRFNRPVLYLHATIPTMVPLVMATLWTVTGVGDRASDVEHLSHQFVHAITHPVSPSMRFMQDIMPYLVDWLVPIEVSYYKLEETGVMTYLWYEVLGWITLLGLITICILLLLRGILRTQYAVPFLFVTLYLSVFLFTISSVWSNEGGFGSMEISYRRMSPVYAPLLVMLMVFLLDRMKFDFRRLRSVVTGSMVCVLLAALVVASLAGWYNVGTNPTANNWRPYYDTTFAHELRTTLIDEPHIHSNFAALAYYMADQPTRVTYWLWPTSPHISPGDWLVIYNDEYKHSSLRSKELLLRKLPFVLDPAYDDEVGTIYQVMRAK